MRDFAEPTVPESEDDDWDAEEEDEEDDDAEWVDDPAEAGQHLAEDLYAVQTWIGDWDGQQLTLDTALEMLDSRLPADARRRSSRFVAS